ncbi:MAG: DUF2934 domain-containing protein, partial [Rubrivivax sp.]|nr:DUF2934 domain-containing protein [Rubrivivax sp.]
MTASASASRQGTTRARAIAPTVEVDLSVEPSETSDQPRRQVMIAEAAFFIAQARGFVPGQELDDWLAAESEVDQRLSAT